MKIIFALLGFFIVNNVNAQSFYLHDENVVFKIDSGNHVAWARDFSGKVYSQSQDTNIVKRVTGDNKFVYVWVIQGDTTLMTGYYYSTLHILDTNGNLVSQQSNQIGPFHVYTACGFMPSLKGGVWMADKNSQSVNRNGLIHKIDSTGLYDTTSNAIYFLSATYNDIHALETMADSSYLAVADYWSISSMIPLTISCVKFDEDGHFIWKYDFSGPAPDENLSLTGVVTDSLNNIYLVGDYYNSMGVAFGLFAIKLNSAGQILHSHLFPDLVNTFYKYKDNLKLSDSILYLAFNDSVIRFDTSFTNVCLNQTPNFNVNISSSNVICAPLTVPNYIINAFSPDTITYNYVPVSIHVYPFYCFSLGEAEVDRNIFNVWPNPAMNFISVESSEELRRIGIYDVQGKKIEEINFAGGVFETRIDLGILETGVYFMAVESVIGERMVKKIIHC